jgi:hypothetical protein
MKKVLARMALVGLVAAGFTTGVAGSASAAACTVNVSTFQAYNVNCAWVKHFDRLTDGRLMVAPVAYPGGWSTQYACWNNVASYGAYRGPWVMI